MIIVKLISLLLLTCGRLYATELVQIDVGNSLKFEGVLNMQPTNFVDRSNHGTSMALALESQLKEVHSKPVVAKQVLWVYSQKSVQSLINAMREALNEEPRVLSLSYGGRSSSGIEEAFMMAFAAKDTVIVAAAGNDGGGRMYYPANYPNSCILSVGTTINGYKTMYSNNADSWLEYNVEDPPGTSASTARMAAIVLQIRRHNPELTCDKVVTTVKMLYGKVKK